MTRPQGTGERGEILTDAMLAALPNHLRPVTVGGRMRAGCPFHGSDRQRSLTVNTETGRFQCFSCGVWGYTEQARADYLERTKADRSRALPPQPWQRPSGALKLRADPKEPEPLPEDWRRRLEAWRSSLPEAAEYLAGRRIPLELVRQLGGGVGMLGGARRLVLPHTTPAGELVSLYGRRIDAVDDAKHYHLSGRLKGWLNAPIVRGASELWICEGPFDALALMAAGIPHAVAVFGVQGIRWNWLPPSVRRLVLAFDVDETGRKAILEHAPQAILRGLDVLQVMPDELGGAKDIAEAWQNGTLQLTGLDAQNSAITAAATVAGIPENRYGTDTAQGASGALATSSTAVDAEARYKNSAATAPPAEVFTAVRAREAEPGFCESIKSAGPTLRELVASIPEQAPAGLPGDRWADFIRSARRFVREHAEAATAAGWNELELFGLPEPKRPWEGGAVWSLAGCEIREVTSGYIRAVNSAGASCSCWRSQTSSAGLPW